VRGIEVTSIAIISKVKVPSVEDDIMKLITHVGQLCLEPEDKVGK
jgi:hypothetical protein